jgi:eukaryotic-like serine/threonine-protein kinase
LPGDEAYVTEPPADPNWPEPADTVVQPASPPPQSRVVFEEPAPPRRWEDVTGWLLALLFLVAALIFLFLWLHERNRSGSTHRVPNLVGETEVQAQRDIAANGFALNTVSKPASQPSGQVLAQGPAAGASLGRGSTVLIVVSAGKGQISVPNVTGLKLKAALAALSAVQLQSKVTRQQSTKPNDTVLSQKPAAGQQVAKSATITLVVANGPNQVAVPALQGMTEANAVSALQAAGLVPDVKQVPSAEPRGTVIAQKPPPQQKVARGAHVRLNVSDGSQKSTSTSTVVSVQTATVTTAQTSTANRTVTRTTATTVTTTPP